MTLHLIPKQFREGEQNNEAKRVNIENNSAKTEIIRQIYNKFKKIYNIQNKISKINYSSKYYKVVTTGKLGERYIQELHVVAS